jgi:hypothetical protein
MPITIAAVKMFIIDILLQKKHNINENSACLNNVLTLFVSKYVKLLVTLQSEIKRIFVNCKNPGGTMVLMIAPRHLLN